METIQERLRRDEDAHIAGYPPARRIVAEHLLEARNHIDTLSSALAAKDEEIERLKDAGKVLVGANTKHFDSARREGERAERAEAALTASQARIAEMTGALRQASTYVEEYVQGNGGIDGCEMQDRITLERIRETLNKGA